MKKILMSLTIAAFAYFNAEAQNLPAKSCGIAAGQVCKGNAKTGAYCYKTPYAQNFAVCKNNYGYRICCEQPNSTNSTYPRLSLLSQRQFVAPVLYERQNNRSNAVAVTKVVTPQSQSYPPVFEISSQNSYEGYYVSKHQIKVCYGGDNVAEENRAAYQGCPTPAYDGPEKNRERNLNEANENARLAPITGRSF